MNLSGDLKGMSYGDVLPFMQNPIDPRVFMFRGLATNETTGLLRTHVDDLMLLAERGFKKEIGKDSKLFPPSTPTNSCLGTNAQPLSGSEGGDFSKQVPGG